MAIAASGMQRRRTVCSCLRGESPDLPGGNILIDYDRDHQSSRQAASGPVEFLHRELRYRPLRRRGIRRALWRAALPPRSTPRSGSISSSHSASRRRRVHQLGVNVRSCSRARRFFSDSSEKAALRRARAAADRVRGLREGRRGPDAAFRACGLSAGPPCADHHWGIAFRPGLGAYVRDDLTGFDPAFPVSHAIHDPRSRPSNGASRRCTPGHH